ncbi:ATP synthase F1 subunit delta [Candidatus Poribacteria bacterium]|nr:MAG: ATP synthase F1 subunit delta [Candidatus Poribacteria bacterium]
MRAGEIARRYARALIKSALDYVESDVKVLKEAVSSSEQLRELLTNPVIPPGAKKEAIERLFEGRVHEVTLNFLRTLIQKRREALLPEILESFEEELDRAKGIKVVEVTTVVPLTEEQRRRLVEKVKAAVEGEIRLEERIDPSIKGGMLIKIGDTTIDATFSTMLEKVREHLLSRVEEG